MDIDYPKVMFGPNAIHVPAWMVVQEMGQGGVALVGASLSRLPLYGSTLPHVLVAGELIIRPHVAVASDKLRGLGAAGLLTCGWQPEYWQDGQFLVGSLDDLIQKYRGGRS